MSTNVQAIEAWSAENSVGSEEVAEELEMKYSPRDCMFDVGTPPVPEVPSLIAVQKEALVTVRAVASSSSEAMARKCR